MLTRAQKEEQVAELKDKFGRATSQMDRMLHIFNSLDPILKRYRLVEKGARPDALGYVGLRSAIPHGDRVTQFNASRIIGRSHYEPNYLASPLLLGKLQRELLWRQ